MGLLVDGQWQDKWYPTDENEGMERPGQPGKADSKRNRGVIIFMCLTPVRGPTGH